MEQPSEPAAPAHAPAAVESIKPVVPAAPAMPATPLMMSPTPVEKQSNNSSAPNMLDGARIAVPPPSSGARASASASTGTGCGQRHHRRDHDAAVRPHQARHDRGAAERAAARCHRRSRIARRRAEGRPGRGLRDRCALCRRQGRCGGSRPGREMVRPRGAGRRGAGAVPARHLLREGPEREEGRRYRAALLRAGGRARQRQGDA